MNQNSLQLEQYLHKFYREVCDILKCQILVLRIDDIDMSFFHGFDVLETIRKFCASPYLLPIVTGHSELYNMIITKNFTQEMENKAFLTEQE